MSYRLLNSGTRSFEFPIPRYVDTIEDFGDFCDHIYFLFLDTFSNYRQIRARQSD